jgi:formylglycine-generating enzyme required for sulfatase activity
MAVPCPRAALCFVCCVAAPCWVLGVTLPRPVAAADGTRSGFSLPLRPAEQALSGGVRSLRAPAPLMIRVRAGTFRMGSSHAETLEAAADCAREPLGFRCNETTFADEMPAHDVTLSAFWLDRTEVTVEAYARCVEVRRCKPLPFGQGATRFDKPSYPASLVSFDDALAYCRFRGARLPTEAEFERAARGPARRRFPWGNLYNSRAANHGRLGWDASDPSDGFAELAPAGAYLAGRTPEGFMDLAGNVAEWVNDRYAANYPEGPQKNPGGPSAPPASSERVVRGGSYAQAAPWLRGAARRFQEPAARRPNIGFRCARSGAPQ